MRPCTLAAIHEHSPDLMCQLESIVIASCSNSMLVLNYTVRHASIHNILCAENHAYAAICNHCCNNLQHTI